MFSLPKKLIFGDDAKLEFKRAPNGIPRLFEERNIPPTDDRYWSQYTRIFDTPSDVFSLLSISDVRRALQQAPENIRTLVLLLSAHLFSLILDPEFAAQSASSALGGLALGIGFGGAGAGGAGKNGRDRTKEALNCVRVLARVVPCILEGEQTDGAASGADRSMSEFERELFWKRETRRVRKPVAEAEGIESGEPEESQFVIDDEEEEEGIVGGGSGGADEEKVEGAEEGGKNDKEGKKDDGDSEDGTMEEALPTLAERLLTAVVDLLFYGNFAIPVTEPDAPRINHQIWEAGVGSSTDIGSNRELDAVKVELLRLLLALFSKTMYVAAPLSTSTDNPYVRFVVQSMPRAVVLCLLCSLLNISVRHTSSGLFTLPYNHLVYERVVGEDVRDPLVTLSLQVLNVLLAYHPPKSAPTSLSLDPAAVESPDFFSSSTPSSNGFRFYLSKLHRRADFEFVTNGIFGVFAQPMSANAQLLPGSQKPVKYVPEALILFWRLVDCNKKYRSFLLDNGRSPEILAFLLYYSLFFKDDPAQQGLVRTCIFLLQDLSADRSFGVHLNKPLPAKVRLPSRYATSRGTAADTLVQSIYTLIASTRGTLSNLYLPLIITLTNASPYFKHLSVVSATRLLQLFKSMSSPGFVLCEEGNPRLVFYLLEAFTNVIHYQYSDNPNLIYAVIRSHQSFDKLATFTLRKGLSEVKRVKESAKNKAPGTLTGTGTAPSSPRSGKTALPDVPTSLEGIASPAKDEKAALAEKEAAEVAAMQKGMTGQDGAGGSAASTSAADAADEAVVGEEAGGKRSGAASPTGATQETNEGATSDASATPPSEKARGKMRQLSVSSVALGSVGSAQAEDAQLIDPEDVPAAAAAVGKNGFVPSQEWVTSWQKGLPLDSIQLMLSELVPKVSSLAQSHQASSGANVDAAVLDFLKSATLVGILPPAQPIHPRKFRWTEQAHIWLLSYLWGGIFVHAMVPFAVFNGTSIRLFLLKEEDRRDSPGQLAVSAASNAINGVLRSPFSLVRGGVPSGMVNASGGGGGGGGVPTSSSTTTLSSSPSSSPSPSPSGAGATGERRTSRIV